MSNSNSIQDNCHDIEQELDDVKQNMTSIKEFLTVLKEHKTLFDETDFKIVYDTVLELEDQCNILEDSLKTLRARLAKQEQLRVASQTLRSREDVLNEHGANVFAKNPSMMERFVDRQKQLLRQLRSVEDQV